MFSSRPLVNQLQRELNLARSPRRTADFAETGSHQRVRWQTHIDDVEDVEKLGAKLQIHQFNTARAPAKRRALDQGKIKVIVSRPTKRVAPQLAEHPVVRTGSPRHIDRNREVRSIVCPQ